MTTLAVPSAQPPVARVFERHLSEHAGEYFPDLTADPAHVSLRREHVRRYSTLYEFEIRTRHTRRTVLVKMPSADRHSPPPSAPEANAVRDRPRRAVTLDPGRKSEVEYAALTLIHDAFRRLSDPRFGTVAPLDFVRPHQALVMEKLSDPRLDALMLKASRLHPSPPRELPTALRNTGAWLRTYHAIDPPEHARVRHATRSDFTAYVAELAQYLTVHERRSAVFDHARALIFTMARDVLPTELPLGTMHGDFAPRNVLVGEGGRVTVIDTLARWRAPIYEDLADFLFGLKASNAQMYTGGRMFAGSVVSAWEEAFLAGYLGAAPRPLSALRLFEVQAVLERWASVRRVALGRAAGRNPRRRLQTAAATRFLRRYLASLLLDLEKRR